MKQLRLSAAIAFAIVLMSAPVSALDLDGFLAEVNVAARADLGTFRADLSGTFQVSSRELDRLFDFFPTPADVYISLRIGQIANVPVERVATVYSQNRGQGWGAIAKSLGIKPGSAEFHALKQGSMAARTEGRSTANKTGKANGNRGNGKK